MYRLKRRIKMLSNLKRYLQGVTSKSLCIEEHLYENITNIQYSCLYNNTIPEAHCFAFDFIKGKEIEVDAPAADAWDLVYTSDTKDFHAATNQETFEAISHRFKTDCLPYWVV